LRRGYGNRLEALAGAIRLMKGWPRRSALVLIALLLPTGCGARRRAAAPVAHPGQLQFRDYCAACHQYDGQGMGDAPPLDASPWVTGPQERLIKLVLHGVRGPMQIAGKTYDVEMPGFAPVMPDGDVASLLSFVRKRFGGIDDPVTAEAVTRVRAAHRGRTGYWSVEELKGR
jgi:mono/diheme cytochrome c family protein